jgi:ABC-2 type transport system permease protein
MADIAIPRRLPGRVPVFGTQLRYQLLMLWRAPRAFTSGLILPGALLALELGGHEHNEPLTWLALRVAGLVVFGAAGIAYYTNANSLVVAREEGILRRWRAAPLPAWAYFAPKILAGVLAADLSGAILVYVGRGMAGLHLTSHAILGLLVIGTLGALALAAVGTAVTTVIPTTQSAQPMLMLTYIPVLVISGAFGPLEGLPSWLNRTVTYLPVQPVIDAATRALEHSSGTLVSTHDLAVLAGWTVGCLLFSARFFRWDPHRPARARHSGLSGAARPE